MGPLPPEAAVAEGGAAIGHVFSRSSGWAVALSSPLYPGLDAHGAISMLLSVGRHEVSRSLRSLHLSHTAGTYKSITYTLKDTVLRLTRAERGLGVGGWELERVGGGGGDCCCLVGS